MQHEFQLGKVRWLVRGGPGYRWFWRQGPWALTGSGVDAEQRRQLVEAMNDSREVARQALMLPVEAVDPGDPEAEVRRSLRVPAVAGEEADTLGTDIQPLDRKPVDAGVGLVDADKIGRAHV